MRVCISIKKRIMPRTRPRGVRSSTEIKSIADMTSKWDFRNFFHEYLILFHTVIQRFLHVQQKLLNRLVCHA